MSVKDTAKRQYKKLVDTALRQISALRVPPEGWIATVRKALSMSGPQLAKRAGITRAAVYQAERNERDGAITLNQMEKMARALGGKFVYAIVPNGKVEDVIRAQALRRAEGLVRRASSHMALELQSLPPEGTQTEIDQLADDLIRRMPTDFWESR
ncbi:putative DNA-binding mobile mystery protein A [Phyllobacterium trifolii]|jgi:predicted DNA-binding mobile mystery protein A|uniref:Putative DNA-binding mobile mystery protein A n=1 Tax=Phyllobacterium trifolii TaxID=300193 RepID=A0A839U2K9_9HYPH|nr:mobile mystery protein A [Phyllobacterium trifolii]MBB3144878.1 putative DNA-binding mobile mystery protein A [Phyllobacterium trifolii]